MILMALAAAALVQWTGPRTEEYLGPGNFCGGGYRISLAPGDRALILPQDTAGQGARLILAGREVNVHSGAQPAPGPVVLRYGRMAVTEQHEGGSVAYTVSNDTPYGMRLTSDAFHGFKRDRWFFSHANFAADSERGVQCLSAHSY